MLKFIGTLFFVTGVTCLAPSIPYICEWKRVVEGPTECTDCSTWTYCYEYIYDQPRCKLALAGDCYIVNGNVGCLRRTYWCMPMSGGECACWTDNLLSEQGWYLTNRDVCLSSPPP